MKLNVLLTGSNGFLGKHIALELDTQFNIFTLSRTNSKINCDLIDNQPKLPLIDIVIHSAGLAHNIPKSRADESSFFKTNVNGTANLLSALNVLSVKPKSFIFISSVSVYGLFNGQNINEEYPLLAKDPYGKSKIEAEKLVTEWCIKNDVVCTILRLPLIVGSNPPGNLGKMINGIKNGFYFNIAGGKANKSMVLASDVSKYILKASEKGGIYNLTDGYHPNFYELSYSIANLIGKNNLLNIPYLVSKTLALIGDRLGKFFPFNSFMLSKITSTLTFDDTKARLAFGWNPNSVLKFYKNNE